MLAWCHARRETLQFSPGILIARRMTMKAGLLVRSEPLKATPLGLPAPFKATRSFLGHGSHRPQALWSRESRPNLEPWAMSACRENPVVKRQALRGRIVAIVTRACRVGEPIPRQVGRDARPEPEETSHLAYRETGPLADTAPVLVWYTIDRNYSR